jgi:chemotaxis protein methyltransferase CheR
MTTMVANEANLSEREFKAFQKLIYDLAGISLADTKQIMVQGRLSKRLRALDISSYREYYERLCSKQAGDEVERFINALTTNKTDFFREAHHFDYLTNTIFPKLAARAERTGSKKIRIWCSASSTGEEPYTIAMTIREYFGAQSDWDIRVLASDIDTDVLKTAQEGWYVDDRFDELPNALKKKYFEPVGDGSEKGDHFGSVKVAAGSLKGSHLKAWFH